jgi:hypothetical protein
MRNPGLAMECRNLSITGRLREEKMKWEGCFAVVSEQRDVAAAISGMIVVVEGLVRRGLVETDKQNVAVMRKVINALEIV